MSFIILYGDHKTIGFRDLAGRPPTAASAGKKSRLPKLTKMKLDI
jgi:hypothetical protein